MNGVFLIGVPGVGKSVVVRELQRRGWLAADTDELAADALGVRVEDLVTLTQADERRAATRLALSTILAHIPSDPFVVAVSSDALGVGIDDDAGAAMRDQLAAKGAHVWYLTASLSALSTRTGLVGQRSASLIMPRRTFKLMIDKRAPIFEEAATNVLDTSELSVSEVADAIEAEFGPAR